MILTGQRITQAVEAGEIVIDPFRPEAVNPNSYNYRLGPLIKVYDAESSSFRDAVLPEEGYILQSGVMYLGHTAEVIGSTRYAMKLIGRSSTGRLGLFVQVSADLGHTTSCHRWTLEMVASRPIRVYPHMVIGQVSFWRNAGAIVPAPAFYARFNSPHESLIGASSDPHGR
jgi:dCTP deaminase